MLPNLDNNKRIALYGAPCDESNCLLKQLKMRVGKSDGSPQSFKKIVLDLGLENSFRRGEINGEGYFICPREDCTKVALIDDIRFRI